MSAAGRLRSDRGSAVVEVAIAAPLVLFLVGFITLTGRVGSLRENVQTASADAARAASTHRSSLGAHDTALDTARSTLADQQISCENLTVDVDDTNLTPGGSVAVTVNCAVSLSGLVGLPIPGGKTVSSRSIEVVDKYSPGRP